LNPNEIVLRWLDYARWTPSADNLQPWVVRVESLSEGEIALSVSQKFDRDSADNIHEMIDWLALGSFVASLQVVAQADGFELHSMEFRRNAILSFKRSLNGSADISRANILLERHTRRCPFSKVEIGAPHRQRIEKIFAQHSELSAHWFVGERKSVAGRLMARLDCIRYQNARQFSNLLKVVRFGKEVGSNDGLDVRTFEIPASGIFLLRTLRTFPFLRFIFFLGLERFYAHLGCQRLIENSSALVFIQSRVGGSKSWFEIGRCLQEVWLEATRCGLAFQPYGHSLIAVDALTHPEKYSGSHVLKIEAVKRQFDSIGIDLSRPGLFFRVGYTDTSSAFRSQRFDASKLLLE